MCQSWIKGNTKVPNGGFNIRSTSASIFNVQKVTFIRGQTVECVEYYNLIYVGTMIDCKLNCETDCDCVKKKKGARAFVMFEVNFLESVFSFSLVSWFGYLSVKKTENRSLKLLNGLTSWRFLHYVVLCLSVVLICAVRIAHLMQTGFILTASNKVTWMCSFLISWLQIKFVGNKFGNKRVLFSHCV